LGVFKDLKKKKLEKKMNLVLGWNLGIFLPLLLDLKKKG
jgi:hypothetical protein